MGTDKPHSKLGIFSCVISAGMFFLFLVSILLYVLQSKQIIGISLWQQIGLWVIFTMMILPVWVHGFGFILAIISLFFPTRKKLFPILGVVSNLIFALLSLFPWLYLTFYSLGRV